MTTVIDTHSKLIYHPFTTYLSLSRKTSTQDRCARNHHGNRNDNTGELQGRLHQGCILSPPHLPQFPPMLEVHLGATWCGSNALDTELCPAACNDDDLSL
jgi:hypothetical protein